MSYNCKLDTGKTIRYSLKRRKRDPHYLVCFRGPDRKRLERSTYATSLQRAQDSAEATIAEVYAPKPEAGPESECLTWDEAIERMQKSMEGEKLRVGSIQQYVYAVRSLEKTIEGRRGPAEISVGDAEAYKLKRAEDVKDVTVAHNLRHLTAAYSTWFRDKLKILTENPFADVAPPILDKPHKRIIQEAEETAFREWLSERWDAWRLPLLLLDVKSAIGCRIGELCAASKLKDGRIVFEAETTKGRKERRCLLPAEIFTELKAIAGKTFLFERFADELREIHTRRGNLPHAARVKEFAPSRLKKWLEDEAKLYFETTGADRFKLHNFRGTFITRARMAGMTADDIAHAAGVSPQVAREHYENTDNTAISDMVLRASWGQPAPKAEGKKQRGGRKRVREK